MGIYLKNNKKVKIDLKILVQRYWWRVLTILLAAFVFNLGIYVFLSRAQTIPSGVTGIPTLINYIIPSTKKYFSLIYLGINVPLFLIFGRRIKRSFLALTILFMVFQILVQTTIFDQVPVKNFFNEKFVLTAKVNLTGVHDNDPSNLLYTIIGAALIGIGISLSWKAGGSTGGTDIIGYYFSMKSKKNIGFTLSIIGYVTAIVFLVIFAFIQPNVVADADGKKHKVIFGVREISTFIYVFVINYVVDLMYPKYKKVTLSIVSNTPDKILGYFKLIDYWHSYRIERFKSGYTGKQGVKITTSILILESPNLIHDLKFIDPHIWISITDERKIIGKFNTNYVE
ncbi:YitT family protein [Mycoplasma sp. OR1901]|nr:YitT family protein [Mycoplasma sp. OR1901]